MLDKHESRPTRTEIREVLFEVWDPIGVKHEANAEDEYDCCVGPLFSLLTSGATDDQISEYLSSRAVEHMGVNPERETTRTTIVALRKITLPQSTT
jgi:hypothetical protein